MPEELILVSRRAQRLNGVDLSRCQDVVWRDAFSSRGVQTLRAHVSHIDHNGNGVRIVVTSQLASLEAVWASWLIRLDKTSWQVVVSGVRTKIREFDMVVVCQGGVVGD